MIKTTIIKTALYIDLSCIWFSIMMMWLINGTMPTTIYIVLLVLSVVHMALMFWMLKKKIRKRGNADGSDETIN